MVKYLAAKQETRVQSLGHEDSLEQEMVPVFLPGKSYGQGSLVSYSPWGLNNYNINIYAHIYVCIYIVLISKYL